MSSLNPSVPDCDVIHDLIPDYAFGLTSMDETRLVENHLADCPDASAQLDDFRRLQDAMREDVPQIEPPPQLANRLMAAIAAPQPQPRRSRWASLSSSWAWLAAAAVVALVVTNLYWLMRVNTTNTPTDSLSSDNAFILTSTSNLRWARLPASQDTSQASAFLMWNGESKIGLLYVRGFEEMDATDTYRLWLTKGSEKVSAGTFSVDTKGIGTLLFHITDPIDKYTWARITDEVTGEVVANGELPVN